MFEHELNQAYEAILKELERQQITPPDEATWAPTPFQGLWGFGTAICFQAAANEARQGKKVNVPQRAQAIAESALPALKDLGLFEHVAAERGYINVFVKQSEYAQRVIDTILSQADKFGQADPTGQRVMVEYSQPNTHKAFHVGHLRNTILGSSVANILEAAGHDVVRANYLGDIGWHVIKWLWCYLKFHAGEQPEGDPTRWMDAIYQKAARLVEENPEYEAEAREVFSRWDQGDEELRSLWSKTRQWSLEGFQEIYDWLIADFDVLFFESDVEEPGKKLVEEMIDRGLAIDERPEGGAVVTKLDELLGLDKETYRVLVILRSDGTSLYASKDLPLAIKKFEEYDLDRSIYVIDVRQSLYLKQIFKTLELLGYEWAQNCIHLSYEIVNLPGNVTMSSREGTVVLFDDLRSEAVERAEAIVLEKNPELGSDVRRVVATQVALGAIKYPMLSVDNNKVATFDWERALDFEGQAAPYIQYAHVRANSILKRAGDFPASMTPEYDLEPQEVQLLEKLAQFPGDVLRSAEELKPLTLANYAYELAKVFTSFYQNCQVIKAEPAVQANRLRLTAAARQVLANALTLLGIPAPDVM